MQDKVLDHEAEAPIKSGIELIEALGEETLREYRDCLKTKKRLKISLTTKIWVTDGDMHEAAIDRPAEEVTVIQNEYMIGLISMKLEGIPKDRREIDNNFIILMAIIEESY